jgi:hypothetical protein
VTPPRGETVAIYSDHAQTIYEIVHHFQKMLGLKHECPQEREKLASMAQERWLALFGHFSKRISNSTAFPCSGSGASTSADISHY